VHGDARSRRLVVVPDALLNPPAGTADRITDLMGGGWGLIVLPPRDVAAATRAASLEAIVEEVVVFLDGGYEVAIVRVDDEALAEFVGALRAAGHDITRELELRP